MIAYSSRNLTFASASALMKRRAILAGGAAALVAAFTATPSPVQAATIITEQGTTVTFDTLPAVQDWSTANIAGGAGDVVTAAAMDARVATYTAAQFNTELSPSATAGGAGAAALGRYNTTDLNISTRPTSVLLTPLMATLENGAGGRVSSLSISYDLGAIAPVGPDPGLEGHRVYFSLDGTSWTNIAPLSNIGTPGRLATSVDLGGWATGALLYLLWIDDNGPSTDTGFTLDNVSFVPTLERIGRTLVYNRSHTVGGAPNGRLSTTGDYFLESQTPTAFASTDVVNFSQDGSTNIDVPADVATGGVVVSHTSGTYTIGGAGRIRGPLTKSNAGTVVFTTANEFSRSTITGGTVETQAGALGSGLVTIGGGALWKVTLTAQTHNGSLSTDTGGATIQTDFDFTANGLDGTDLLTKTGPGTLLLRGGGSGVGRLNVVTGKLSLAGPVGGATQSITMNGNPLEFTNSGEITFSDFNNSRTIDLGANGGTITVATAGAGVIIGGPDGLSAGGTITKLGPGALRMAGFSNLLTSNWVVNAGTLEARSGSPLGPGTVTVNAGARFAGQNTQVPNDVILAGGELATRSGDATDFAGVINVTAPSTVFMRSYTTQANPQDIRISGALRGAGDLTLLGTAGSTKALILTNRENTYTGTFLVSASQTVSSEPFAAGEGATTPFNARPIVLSGGTVRVRDDGAGDNGTLLVYGNNITVDTQDSGLDISGFGATDNTVQFGTLSIGGQTLNVTTGNSYKARFSGTTTLSGNATFNTTENSELVLAGAISGAFGITKAGLGRLAIDGVNSYTGVTTVAAGTLGGVGTIAGAMTVAPSATAAPGNGTGTLSLLGNLTLDAGANLSLDLAAPTVGALRPGVDYDQLAVVNGIGDNSTGSVTINGANLVLTLGTGIRPNNLFFILRNDGNDPITGTFNNLPDLSLFTSGGQEFQISYNADVSRGLFTGGNDLALVAVPEPGSAALLLFGSALLLRRRRRASPASVEAGQSSARISVTIR